MKNSLKDLRAEHGYSQQRLGELAGVSRQTINSLEAQRYEPSLRLAVTLARIFGLHVEEVFHVDEP